MNDEPTLGREALIDTLHEIAAVRTRTLKAVLHRLQDERRTLAAVISNEAEILDILRSNPACAEEVGQHVQVLTDLRRSIGTLETMILDLERIASLDRSFGA